MATQRMNVLVYSGPGTAADAVRHCIYTLRSLLSPTYAIFPISGDALLKEPWSATCALLVMPGGADLGYCKTLNGEGNRRISLFVNRGGSYLGFCAGGYYGSSRCEFEVDDPRMAVVGNRELGFYPGICRGLAFPGFVYNSEAGARAAELRINKDAFTDVKENTEKTFRSYYNGGGVFVDSKNLESRGVEVLASYTEDLHVDAGEGAAAVVYRKIGEGHVVLTGSHPEFAPANLVKSPSMPTYSEVVDLIASTEDTRVAFLRLMLQKLGLKVNDEEQKVPSLSRLHLSADEPVDVSDLIASWGEIVTVVDGQEYIKGENDCFQLDKQATVWGVQGLTKAVEAVGNLLPNALTGTPIDDGKTIKTAEEKETEVKKWIILERIEYTSDITNTSQTPEYEKMLKNITLHESNLPTSQETPSFNHDSFYANLSHYHTKLLNESASFGKFFMYGETVTSTSTLLEKNPSLLRHLPTGFTLAATRQISGRGRGSNVWVGPAGAMLFSTLIHHPFSLSPSAPVIFIQYLAALAILRGIKTYAPGYDQLPVKLKWPNDIYVQVPPSGGAPHPPTAAKIGGILVNSSYSGTAYSLVVGIGLNLSNALPTTSLNQLAAAAGLKPLTHEKLLASILAHFEAIYAHFCRRGFSAELEREYYDVWLHTGQIVTLETHGGVRARIRGITRDWGLLLAEELGEGDRATGRVVQLQSDSNSFDFFKGLVRRKV